MINKNLKKVIPHNCKDFKISTNTDVGCTASEIFNWLDNNNKIIPSHSYNGITYRWSFGSSGNNCLNYIYNNLSDKYLELFKEKIINYFGLDKLHLNEIKFEKLGVNDSLNDAYLKRTRFGDLKTLKIDDLSNNYENEMFYSLIWHTDKTFNLSNYKLLIYLNDISENQGGLVVSNPTISPKRINGKCQLFKDTPTTSIEELKFKEVTGKMGTMASFNSHILHRANLPKHGFRKCLHLSFLLPDEKYKHNKYSNNHF
tara:strand:+ start:40 stop:810 length:771 start_codon:yes stop_codon:yes gene_type:complete